MEIKNSRIGPRTKVPHLSYVGDAEIGEDTNIGAGTITANFPHQPGRPKGRTTIGKNVRTGIQNGFVAPVEVGDGAWIAAGSVITKDVPRTRSQSRARARRTRRGMQPGTGTGEYELRSARRDRARAAGPDARRGTVSGEPKPGHWIERGPAEAADGLLRPVPSGARAADRRAARHRARRGDDSRRSRTARPTCRYDESIRGADVFIVQTGCNPIDQHLMELFLLIQAAKLGSAKRITAVIPLFPYARQDRKAKPREPISARLVADMLQLAGADRVLTMDLHAGQIQGFFSIPVDHMTALPLFARHFRDLGLTGDGVVSVSPDAGRAKQAVRFAEMIEANFAIMHKSRPGPRRRRR